MFNKSIIAVLSTTFCLAGDCPPEPPDYTSLKERIITNLKGGFELPFNAQANVEDFSVSSNILSMTMSFEEYPETTYTSHSFIYGDKIIRTRYEVDCLCDDPKKNMLVTVNFNSRYRSGFGPLPDHLDQKRDPPKEVPPQDEEPEILQAGISPATPAIQ